MFGEEELTLVAAIHNDPRDDAPRLAYADWCSIRGLADLAEFIRLMCQQPCPIMSDGRKPRIDVMTWELKDADPDRCARLVDLLGVLYGTERFPETQLFDFYRRGLPLYEKRLQHSYLDVKVSDLTDTPLARFNLSLETNQIAAWLDHPLLGLVDDLRIFPDYFDTEEMSPDDDVDPEVDVPMLTVRTIRALAGWPQLEKLSTLGLCAYLTPGADTLARELLEPRVEVDYSH